MEFLMKTTTITRRVLAATAVSAALMIPTVALPAAMATAGPSYSECSDMYGYEPAEPTTDPNTGRRKFAVKQKATQAMLDCIEAGRMKHGRNHTPDLIVGGVLAAWFGYYLYQKRNGQWKSLGEDWEETKSNIADAAAAREQELAERAEWERQQWERELAERQQWEREQQHEPVYATEPAPAPTAPAPTAPAPNQRGNDEDGWDF